MIVTETYEILDCTYYNPNRLYNSVSFNVSLPSTFELSYVLKYGVTTHSAPYIDIGNASNDRMLVGQYSISGTNGLIIYKGSQTNKPYSTNVSSGVEHTIWFKYDGTSYYYKLDDGGVMTVNNANVNLSKLIHLEGSGTSSNYLRDLKIKPL